MQQLVQDFAEAIRAIDSSRVPFKSYMPGVGPYSEPQLVRQALQFLGERLPDRFAGARTKREPDILIPDRWALEVKLVRPFGDNGKEAEHWSQNLLHPYPGNVSALGDALKLMQRNGSERKGLLVIGFEHSPPVIDLELLISAFERLAADVVHIPLGQRESVIVNGLVHPIHQRARIIGWEIGLQS